MSSQEVQQQIRQKMANATMDVCEATLDLILGGCYTPLKLLSAFGSMAGLSEHASKLRLAEAHAAKKGITTQQAFMELHKMGVFDDHVF